MYPVKVLIRLQGNNIHILISHSKVSSNSLDNFIILILSVTVMAQHIMYAIVITGNACYLFLFCKLRNNSLTSDHSID